MKTIEQQRGKLLADRLELLNEFIVDKKEMPFSAFLEQKGFNEETFLKGLPTSLVHAGIGNATSDSQKLFDYTMAMNDEYVNQYTLFQESKPKNADGECMNCDCASCPDDECPFRQEEDLSRAVVPVDEVSYYADGEWHEAAADIVAGCNLKYPGFSKKAKDNRKKCIADKQKARDEAKKPPAGVTCGATEKWNPRKKKCVKKGGVLHAANKFNLVMVAARKAFLSIVALNLFGIATAINMLKTKSPTKWKKFVSTWFKLGGSENRINIAVNRGKDKKMFPKLKKITGADGMDQYEWSVDGYYNANREDTEETLAVPAGETETAPADPGKLAATAAKGLAGATGILTAIPGAQPAAAWVGLATVSIQAIVPLLKSFAQEKGADVSGIAPVTDIPEDFEPDEQGEGDDKGEGKEEGEGWFSKYKWWLIGGGVGFAALLTTILLLVGRKK